MYRKFLCYSYLPRSHLIGGPRSAVGGEGRGGKHRGFLGIAGEHTFHPTSTVIPRLVSTSTFWRTVAKCINVGGHQPGFLSSLLPRRKLVLLQRHQRSQFPPPTPLQKY